MYLQINEDFFQSFSNYFKTFLGLPGEPGLPGLDGLPGKQTNIKFSFSLGFTIDI
jgi:hypothetical protein